MYCLPPPLSIPSLSLLSTRSLYFILIIFFDRIWDSVLNFWNWQRLLPNLFPHLYNVFHPSLFRSDDSPFSMDRICRSFWPFLFLVGFCWWLYHWDLQPDAELRHWHWCSPPFRVYVQGNPKKLFVIQILSWYDEPLIHIQPWLSRQIKWWVWHENLSRKPSSDGIAKRIAGG